MHLAPERGLQLWRLVATSPLFANFPHHPTLYRPKRTTRNCPSIFFSSSSSSYSPTSTSTSTSSSKFSPRTSQTLTLDGPSSSSSTSSSSSSYSASASARNVIEILEERGLIESITNDDIKVACSNPDSAPVKVYCGFDPTAESLHLGNLLGLIVLSWFQRCGHVPVALLGGATALVGDPSGKSFERPSLDESTINRNLLGIRSNIEQVLRVTIGSMMNGSVDKTFDESLGEEPQEKASQNDEGMRPPKSFLDESNKDEDKITRNGYLDNIKEDEGKVSLQSLDESKTDEENNITKVFHPALVMNNYDWWRDFSLLEFLRDVGKYARVGTMMGKESVKKRLSSEDGMSFTEFTYQLLQGYDFVYLFRNEGVSIQIGGSDQWGNITAGTDLIRKILQKEGAYGLTFPLLLKSDGTKFGKSEEGAIWLSSSMLSPYKFYQHLFATPDADVIKFLKKLTFLGLDEIGELESSMANPGYVANTCQRKLAEEVTRFVHGKEGLEEAIRATQALAPGGTTRLDSRSIEAVASDLPSFSTPYANVVGSPLVNVCVISGLFGSKGAARRFIKQGGLYLNNIKVDDEAKIVESDDIIDSRILLLSAGKKNKIVVRLEP